MQNETIIYGMLEDHTVISRLQLDVEVLNDGLLKKKDLKVIYHKVGFH